MDVSPPGIETENTSRRYGFQLPSQPDGLIELQAEDATAAGNDGMIAGSNRDHGCRKYRYREETWTPCTGTETTGLAAGIYFVRYKTTTESFASWEAEVSLRGPAPQQSF